MKKLIYVFILSTLVSYGQNTSNQTPKQLNQDWKTYSVSEFSIQYPPNWELNQSNQIGASFFLFAPLESKSDQFKENINLIIQDLSAKNIDLNKFVEISENQINSMATNAKIEENKRIMKGSEEYHKMIYSFDQGIYHLKTEQYYWVIKEKAYILTLTTEQSKYNDYKVVGEKMMDSFSIKKK